MSELEPLLEEAAEEIENCYGRETELSKRLRKVATEPEPRALTLDELSCMNGKPVFIVEMGGFSGKEWQILDDDMSVDFNLQDVNLKNGDCYGTYDYGKTWIAYDREPKGE